ncbi:hypothetical protein G7Y89_g5531 [Cudoniella acicularis]|uniref:Fcf2 pre-rRNA processing C-terminal domain-containing protein n=1 Tax=Cudoniella acicularis TaxID=354080 RepID=A0A8H4W3Q2_9HELO|nr:hypothetical protein G7Y89_g5531 [Cudoniella acicularis]
MAPTKYTTRTIPKISLHDFSSRISEITDQLIHAAETDGFFGLTNHGISLSEIESMFSTSERFFSLPDTTKSTVPFSHLNAGWEKNAQIRPSTGQPDQKETRYKILFLIDSPTCNSDRMAQEDLSDEQLRQLLKDAEQRLRAASAVNTRNASQDASLVALQKRFCSLYATTLNPRSSLLSIFSIPKVASGRSIPSYITKTDQGAHINSSLLVKPEERKLANGIRRVEDPVVVKAKFAKAKKSTAGSDWYELPKTNLTPELKRDLQLLRMRSVLDPKRHYKKEASRPQIPEFSQVGTIIEGPTEYFTGRLSNKERKRTLIEEVLEGEKSTQRFKSKYNEIQAAKTSGKKAHYKKMRALRRGSKI